MPTQDLPFEDTIRVLIAEDEGSFLEVLVNVLQSTKRFTVVPCQTGEAALEALRTSRFDVVIVDHTLPGMSGLNVLQWMNEQKLDTPVIMLTGTGSEHIAAETMKLGAYDYIAKDDFDRGHFPIVVSGVFERYLFKKSKGQEASKDIRRDLATLEAFSNTIADLAQVSHNALATATLLSEECQQTLLPLLTPEGREQLSNFHHMLKQEHDVVISVTKSILDMSEAMYSRYKSIQFAQKADKSLQGQVLFNLSDNSIKDTPPQERDSIKTGDRTPQSGSTP